MERKPTVSRVIVLGAGVVGLQIALRLLQDGHNVFIVAQDFPGDEAAHYASPWAGAQWRSHSKADDTEQQSWDRMTYEYWKRQCFREHANSTGLEAQSGLTIYPANLLYDSKDHPDFQPSGDQPTGMGFWFRDFVDSFEVLQQPTWRGVSAAIRYHSIFIDVPRYLDYLLRAARRKGARAVRATIPANGNFVQSIGEVYSLVRNRFGENATTGAVLVNATGLGARALCHDHAVYPIRGQVLLVKGVPKEAVSRIGVDQESGRPYVAYVIPRPLSGTTVIGGCYEEGNWSTAEDPETTRRILERCSPLAPDLLTGHGNSFEVLRCQVGLRPARRGGARMDKEIVRLADSDEETLVVHAYGHGGAGFQNSIGVAQAVSSMLRGRVSSLQARL